MTVTAAETRVEYAGNGTTAIFTYPYQFFENNDLDVYIFDDLSEEGTKLVLGTHYNVTGAMNPSGGTVTMITFAPPAGTTLIIINSPDLVQTLHYVNADDFPADSHEHGLDRLTKICQRLSDRLDRAVRAPDYAPEDSVPDAETLLGAIERAETAADESEQSAINSEYFADQAAASAASIEGDVTAADAAAAAAAASAADAAQSAIDADVAKIIWRDHYSASLRYEINDAVEYEGSSWISLHDDNLGNQPGLFPGQHWDLMAQKGDKGTPGTGTGDMLGANNLSDVSSTTQSRLNLGLGNSAVLNVGTTANTVAAGDDARFTLGGVIVSAAPPPGTAKPGDIWWETDSGLLYIRYDDGTSVQWVIASPQPDFNVFATKAETVGSVHYDAAQTITTAQQLRARQNIAAAPIDALAYSGMQINGAMEVSQERGVDNPVTTNTAYICDGWQLSKAGTMGIYATSTVGGPSGSGLPYIISISVTPAQASLGANDVTYLYQQIEGWRCARLAWGSAQAQPITIGFWTGHARPGVYSVVVRNGVTNRSCAANYTVAAANTWQYNTVTIPGDTGGTWANGNTAGINLCFAMASGTTYTAPAVNTWYGTQYSGGPGQVNGVAATSDVFRITGVTVLPGTQAPIAAQSPNIMRSYGEELMTCRRYWQPLTVAADANASGGGNATTCQINYAPEMRAVPTMSIQAAGNSSNVATANFNGGVSGTSKGNNFSIASAVAGRFYWYGNAFADARL